MFMRDSDRRDAIRGLSYQQSTHPTHGQEIDHIRRTSFRLIVQVPVKRGDHVYVLRICEGVATLVDPWKPETTHLFDGSFYLSQQTRPDAAQEGDLEALAPVYIDQLIQMCERLGHPFRRSLGCRST